jgi:CRP-like cAMP-binding protein
MAIPRSGNFFWLATILFFGYIDLHNPGEIVMPDFRARVIGYLAKERGDSRFPAVLGRIPIFKDLTNCELDAIERILHQREYSTDEVMFRQGEPGMGMYIIQSGKTVVLTEPEGVTLSELGEGEFFGEASLLSEAPRSATVIAKAPTRLLGFFQSDLFALIERNPRLGLKIVIRLAMFLGERLKSTNQQVLDLTEQLRQAKQD